MKLRIKDNSVRLRLSQTDIHTLEETNTVSAICHFSPGSLLVYRVRIIDEGKKISAELGVNEVIISMPAFMFKEWASTDMVGYSETCSNGNGGLSLLIEKDWQCLKPRVHEDESDLFVHPDSHV